MSVLQKRMTLESLKNIMSKAGKKYGMIVSADFTPSMNPEIRWCVRENRAYISVSDLFDLASEPVMRKIADSTFRFIVSGNSDINSENDRLVRDALRANRDLFIERNRFYGNADPLLDSVGRLIDNGLVDLMSVEGIEFGWISRIKVIGTTSSIYGIIGVGDYLKNAPAYVLDYVIFCCVNKLSGKDWKEQKYKFGKLALAEQYLEKNTPFKPKEKSCPVIQWKSKKK